MENYGGDFCGCGGDGFVVRPFFVGCISEQIFKRHTLGAQSAVKLTEPSENIRLGTAYLKYLTEKYSLADALAAYNAGEGNLLRWRSEGREEYGFKETREYVKKVLRSKKVYEKFR